MTEPKKPYAGIPIMDREPDHIREALKGQPDEVVEQALRLHEYARKNHLGLSRLAQQSRIQSGLLSQWFNGAYPGDSSAIAERVRAFFWRLEQQEKYGGLRGFVETQLAQSLWAIFEKTRIIRRIQVVQSPEQLGKSRAALEYQDRNNTGRTVYVEVPGAAKGCGDFIWALADQLDIPYSAKLHEKRIRIKNALESCDLVIIDQAHLPFSWPVGGTRDFLDYLITDLFANGARGIVLIATNSDLFEDIRAFRQRGRYNVGQLLGRMRNEPVTIDPAEDILAEDVHALAERYYKPGAETLRLLHDLATRDQMGHFGLLLDILNEAWTTAKARKRPLSDEIVRATAQRILDGMKKHESLYR
jgi:DNA transposition AAA+ family ATPase